jgi:hypothetical protein
MRTIDQMKHMIDFHSHLDEADIVETDFGGLYLQLEGVTPKGIEILEWIARDLWSGSWNGHTMMVPYEGNQADYVSVHIPYDRVVVKVAAAQPFAMG